MTVIVQLYPALMEMELFAFLCLQLLFGHFLLSLTRDKYKNTVLAIDMKKVAALMKHVWESKLGDTHMLRTHNYSLTTKNLTMLYRYHTLLTAI